MRWEKPSRVQKSPLLLQPSIGRQVDQRKESGESSPGVTPPTVLILFSEPTLHNSVPVKQDAVAVRVAQQNKKRREEKKKKLAKLL